MTTAHLAGLIATLTLVVLLVAAVHLALSGLATVAGGVL